MFADNYLQRNKVGRLIQERYSPKTGMILVIPCYREPDVLQTLQSLRNCKLPGMAVEVIVLINHPEDASAAVIDQNQKTAIELQEWIHQVAGGPLRFFVAGPVPLKKKWAGAGLARKKGMDEAVARFNTFNKLDGIIVSLDADTLVDSNYLTEIEKYFRMNPAHIGATIRVSHQNDTLNEKHLQGITLYETYMKYYKYALGYTGYPWPMFTVGSAFAVTAGAYVKRGGMTRRKAGEDFYFLQNLVQIGTVGEIDETVVHPSARLSDRVPFGTGPVLNKWMSGDEDLTQTYNFEAFDDLRKLFALVDQFFKISNDEFLILIQQLPVSVQSFLHAENFCHEIGMLNNNCAASDTFRIRFFQKFNAFKILKFLNFSHGNYYSKADLFDQLLLLESSKS